MKKKEIREIFLQDFQLERTPEESVKNVNEKFGDGTVTERTVIQWFKKFTNGNMNLDGEHRGRIPVIDNDHLKTIVEAFPRKTTREIAKALDVDRSTVMRHLHQIGKIRKDDKWIAEPPVRVKIMRNFDSKQQISKPFRINSK